VGSRVAVSKRLRYEVLRRDNFACRYCGAFAPLAVLHVDHVTPRKHGGQDIPSNLVTACQDCNSGKAASMPAPEVVADVEALAAQWAGHPAPDPDEDEWREINAYRDAVDFLSQLPAERVLHFIARAFAMVIPYRPTHAELIRGAWGIAEAAADTQPGTTDIWGTP
jgi:hypothetical protein